MRRYLHCAKDRQYYIYDMQLAPVCWTIRCAGCRTRAVRPTVRAFINCGGNKWLIDKFLCCLSSLFELHLFFFLLLVESVRDWQMLKRTWKRSLPVLMYYSDMLVQDLLKVLKNTIQAEFWKLNLSPKNRQVSVTKMNFVVYCTKSSVSLAVQRRWYGEWLRAAENSLEGIGRGLVDIQVRS
jgi:hypothetical protein